MKAIVLRELRALIRTPLGWVVLGCSQLVGAWWYLLLLDHYLSAQQPLLVRLESSLGTGDLVVAPFLGGLPLLALLVAVTAVLGMRTFAEERRAGALALLLAAPRRSAEIVVGKYLGSLIFLTAVVALWGLMPASLALGTQPDFGRLLAGLLGLWLAGAGLLAVAVMASALTEHAGAAALFAFGAGMGLLLIGRGDSAGALLTYAGLTGHYRGFLEGSVGTDDLSYFALLVIASLMLATWRVRRLRRG